MRIAYLPANLAWVVLFGETITSVGSCREVFFGSRRQLVSRLSELGLRVTRANRIESVDAP